jgi:hypothetical protein
MENITPSLVLLWDVKRALEKGLSVGVGVQSYLRRKPQNIFSRQVGEWWRAQNNTKASFDKSALGIYRRHLLDVLETGLKGQAVLLTLKSLETELILSCEDEIQMHTARLPLLSLIPLMFLIFPAMMLLLLLPLLKLLEF